MNNTEELLKTLGHLGALHEVAVGGGHSMTPTIWNGLALLESRCTHCDTSVAMAWRPCGGRWVLWVQHLAHDCTGEVL